MIIVDAPIEYARANGDVRIAFKAYGDGPPVLMLPTMGIAAVFDTTGTEAPMFGFRRIHVDRRGSGYSTRSAPISLDLLVKDCLAVADHLELDSFYVHANFVASFEAVRLALEYPGRVRGLILNNPFRPGFAALPPVAAWRPALDADWDWFASAYVGSWAQPEPGQGVPPSWISHFKDTNDADGFRAVLTLFSEIEDVGPLENLTVPTLVIQRERYRKLAPNSEFYASQIPGAKLVVNDNAHGWILSPESTGEVRKFLIGTLRPEEVPLSWGVRPVQEADSAGVSGLSAREREVLRLISRGQSNKQIAEALTISLPTVATHLRHILDKLGVENRAAAAAWAVRHGLA